MNVLERESGAENERPAVVRVLWVREGRAGRCGGIVMVSDAAVMKAGRARKDERRGDRRTSMARLVEVDERRKIRWMSVQLSSRP